MVCSSLNDGRSLGSRRERVYVLLAQTGHTILSLMPPSPVSVSLIHLPSLRVLAPHLPGGWKGGCHDRRRSQRRACSGDGGRRHRRRRRDRRCGGVRGRGKSTSNPCPPRSVRRRLLFPSAPPASAALPLARPGHGAQRVGSPASCFAHHGLAAHLFVRWFCLVPWRAPPVQAWWPFPCLDLPRFC